jgi:hypothetical protein
VTSSATISKTLLTWLTGARRWRLKFKQRTQHYASYLRTEVSGLLATPQFLDALPGHLRPDPTSQARVRVVLQRLQEFTRI